MSLLFKDALPSMGPTCKTHLTLITCQRPYLLPLHWG